MPKLVHSQPKYRRHRASGQAVVTLNGKRCYLGPHGTKASRREYDRLVAEWMAHGRSLPPSRVDSGISVNQMLVAYLRWAKGYYQGSREVELMKLAVRPLKELYGGSPAGEFGPLALKAVRQRMIDADLCRNECNKWTGRIKRIFKWAVESELIPPSVWHGLQAVRGLSFGRTEARESHPVKPVPTPFIDAIQAHVSPQVWAMIQLQLLTGMRPGEVTIMRTADIDTTGAAWVYTPRTHKTARHGHRRQVFLGPKAQSLLRPWLRTELDAHLFQPREAVEWQRQERRAKRTTPESCGNVPGSNRVKRPRREPAEMYKVGAYGNAIRRACKNADVPAWHPHQLRHNRATELRKEHGLDVARVVLGHRSPAVTEVYAELDFAKARDVMGKIG